MSEVIKALLLVRDRHPLAQEVVRVHVLVEERHVQHGRGVVAEQLERLAPATPTAIPTVNGNMVRRFLRPDKCPQPKEAQPLSQALTSD